MPPLVLEGDTLGKKQRHYNKYLNRVIAEEVPSRKLEEIAPEETDVQNLLKIDIACKNKDIEYILEVLKREDMLYVSRAIKLSTWLITDRQYADIVNPEYLHSQLFPHMTSKAINKLMLHIRLNLRDEIRAEAFYNHFKDNPKTALKWLPYCSLAFIEKEIVTVNENIRHDPHLLKRLCERSFIVLKKFFEINCDYDQKYASQRAMFLIHTNTEEFLNLTETFEDHYRLKFSAKPTATIMKKCPQRIINSFQKYADIIDLETFGKMLKKEDIKGFLLKQLENEKLKSWFTFNNLKHIVCHMPKEERFNFLKQTFIEKARQDKNDKIVPYADDFSCIGMACRASAPSSCNPTSSSNIYRWYIYAPFDVAFTDLIKLIRSESSPEERNSILTVLISCAGHNIQHIQTLLQYYHDKHINEPFKFKVQFVNSLISKAATHKFDEKTWNILNNIFCSMEVYIESNNNVQSCIESIIVYKVLRNEKIPETIESKFKFSSLKSKRNKYNDEEKEKIFNYLLSFLKNKLLIESISHEMELREAVALLEDMLTLLKDWEKNLDEYPWIMNVITQLAKIKQTNNWKVDLLSLFNKNKPWRKLMFEESLVMSPSEAACLNALKHDPGLLTRYKSEMESLMRNDDVSLRKLLSKLRVYWPETLASEWTEMYLQRLDEPSGHKSLTIGLCTLLPKDRLVEILKKFAPTESKINWGGDEELLLSLRKQFAKNAHLARPLLSPDAMLQYAQGDYLQFALPSLIAILYDVSATRCRQYISKLLDAPVSLQKHGIRLAFAKLSTAELKETLPNIWKSAKNLTIRSVLFKTAFELLCKEKKPSMIEEIWEILSAFIDNLSNDENKVIYGILGKVEEVPLVVRGKFLMKSYKMLKSLPTTANCENILLKVENYTVKIMEDLDEDFVAEILLESLDTFTTKQYAHKDIMVSYLLSSKTEESQTRKFDKILAPLLDRSFTLWDVKVESYVVRSNLDDLLRTFCYLFIEIVFEKDTVLPVNMFAKILKKLEEKISVEQFYVMMRFWKLTVMLVEILEEHKEIVSNIRNSDTTTRKKDDYANRSIIKWDEVFIKASGKFAERCLQCLQEDTKAYCASAWLAQADALQTMFSNINMNLVPYLHIIKDLLRKEFVESYLLALKALPLQYYCEAKEKVLIKEICKQIYSHPSPEVKIHYCRGFENGQDFENDIPNK